VDGERKSEGEIYSLANFLKRLLAVQNLLVGRIDPSGSLKSTNGMVKRLKTQSGRIWINLASNQSARHPDSNDVNDTQIQDDLKKLEQVKVQV